MHGENCALKTNGTVKPAYSGIPKDLKPSQLYACTSGKPLLYDNKIGTIHNSGI
jgi:hypothetical protein